MKRYKVTKRFKRAVILMFLPLAIAVVITSAKADTPIQYDTYTVQRGDTLWSIARRYNNTGKDIREYIYDIEQLNNCTPTLQVGQTLTIIK